jgi:hypothetical protein
VVWLWAADDLFMLHPELADWRWMLESGEYSSGRFMRLGLIQATASIAGSRSFHDITNSAYPDGMKIADRVLLKALSTNCLYYRGALAMANACEKSGRPTAEKQAWLARAAALKAAIVQVFTKSDGTLAYYKDRHGKIMPHREISGTAFAAIFRNSRSRRGEGGVRELSRDGQGHSAVFAVHSWQHRAAQHGQLAVLRHFLSVGQVRGRWG